MAMNDELFADLMASVAEAGQIERGEAAPSRVFTRNREPLDVAGIREHYRLSQARSPRSSAFLHIVPDAVLFSHMTKELSYYLGLPYTFEVHLDSGGNWFSRVRELPGCMSQGDTPEEALQNSREVLRLWLESAIESGFEIPEPREEENYSGKFLVRVPRSLHRALSEIADREGVSLNQYINVALAGATGLRWDKKWEDDTMTLNLGSLLTGLIGQKLYTTSGSGFLVTGVTPARVMVAVGPAQRTHAVSIANLQRGVAYAHANGKNALSGPADYCNLIADDRPAYAWAILHHLGFV